MTRPGFWTSEESGVLSPVVLKYLEGRELAPDEVATMRAYLRQWIQAPLFVGPEVDGLRAAVDALETHRDLELWLARALAAGVDPL